jgi:hypothetical protein
MHLTVAASCLAASCVQELEGCELVTPLGAPKFVERAQVKTIDTPRVRTLPAAEMKKRQAAIEAYGAVLKKGEAIGDRQEAYTDFSSAAGET